jgi:hypothetical protein
VCGYYVLNSVSKTFPKSGVFALHVLSTHSSRDFRDEAKRGNCKHYQANVQFRQGDVPKSRSIG